MRLEELRGMIGEPVVYCPTGEGMTEGGILAGATDINALVNFRGVIRACDPEDILDPASVRLKCRQCHGDVMLDQGAGTFRHAEIGDSIFCGLLPMMESA